MRITLPIVLLLFGASSAHGQTRSAPSAVASAEAAPALTQSTPATAQDSAISTAPTRPQPSVRAEETKTVEPARAQEPKQPSRVVWILVGAVLVLATILVVSR
jgi:hypothetical protein